MIATGALETDNEMIEPKVSESVAVSYDPEVTPLLRVAVVAAEEAGTANGDDARSRRPNMV